MIELCLSVVVEKRGLQQTASFPFCLGTVHPNHRRDADQEGALFLA